jgi:GNAT superfamily N-acetyltransferase
MVVRIRPATLDDAEPCGRILSDAFTEVHVRHGFAPDFPDHDGAIRFMRGPIANPRAYGVIAEIDGRVVGSNFLDERDSVRAVGPLSVHPLAQGRGVGRLLMRSVLERGRSAPSIRLVQEAFNLISLGLYTSLGFDPVEQLVVIEGRPRTRPPRDLEVRRAEYRDLPACDSLSKEIHGYARSEELRDALRIMSPYVAIREGRVVAYCTTLTSWGPAHGVAQTDSDMRALILGVSAAEESPVQFLVPVRESELFRWCLAEGLRTVKPMTLMAAGEYRAPQGSWFPSALY